MIPLRLRRRRDGTVWLVDADGRTAGELAFPETHAFRWVWLAQNSDIARVDGGRVVVTLANARAVYEIVEVDPPQPTNVNLRLVEQEIG